LVPLLSVSSFLPTSSTLSCFTECTFFEQCSTDCGCFMAVCNLFHMLAKNVVDGQNFRIVMENFMSDVQYDSLC
jgi:hypothetical protein